MSLSSTISPIWNTLVSVSAGSAWASPGRTLSQAASLVGVESFSGVELLGPVLSWIYYSRRKYFSDGQRNDNHILPPALHSRFCPAPVHLQCPTPDWWSCRAGTCNAKCPVCPSNMGPALSYNRLIGEVGQSRRRPLLRPSPGWKQSVVQHLKLWESLPPVTKARTCSWLAISSRLQRCFSSSWSWHTVVVSAKY